MVARYLNIEEHFQNEEIMAYMYVSSPAKMIVGRIHLGKRIDINTWKEQYKADKEVSERIDDFLTRHTYAMPVLSFQMTKEIELETLRKLTPQFCMSSNVLLFG